MSILLSIISKFESQFLFIKFETLKAITQFKLKYICIVMLLKNINFITNTNLISFFLIIESLVFLNILLF